MALGDWANALADAEALVEQEIGRSEGLSMRTAAVASCMIRARATGCLPRFRS